MKGCCLALVAVGVLGCSHFRAPPGRPLEPSRGGRLVLIPIPTMDLPIGEWASWRDAAIIGDSLYALFESWPMTLLRWDLRDPMRKAELVPMRDLMRPPVRLGTREGRLVIVSADPRDHESGPADVEFVALPYDKQMVFDVDLNGPFWAHQVAMPAWPPPHGSRLDLILGIFDQAIPRVLATVRDVDQDGVSIVRHESVARVACAVDEGWLYVVEGDSQGDVSEIDYGEPKVHSPKVLRHEGRWLVSYVQDYSKLGIRLEGADRSLIHKLEGEVRSYDALSIGDQLVFLIDVFNKGMIALRLDSDGEWREYRGDSSPIWRLRLFQYGKHILCLGEIDKTHMGLFRVEMSD